MRVGIILIIISCTLNSCVSSKSTGRVVEDESKIYFVDSINRLQIPFLADYWFHDFKRSQFINASARFLKYTKSNLGVKKTHFVLATHTFIQPLFSLIVTINKDVSDTSYIQHVKNSFNKYISSKNISPEVFTSAYGVGHKMRYQVYNKETNIYTFNIEYLIKIGNDLVRLFFWTIDSDPTIFLAESENIAKNARGL